MNLSNQLLGREMERRKDESHVFQGQAPIKSAHSAVEVVKQLHGNVERGELRESEKKRKERTLSPQISSASVPVDCTSGPLHCCFLCLPALCHFYWTLLILHTSQFRPCLLGGLSTTWFCFIIPWITICHIFLYSILGHYLSTPTRLLVHLLQEFLLESSPTSS